jgi:hypothetical protein
MRLLDGELTIFRNDIGISHLENHTTVELCQKCHARSVPNWTQPIFFHERYHVLQLEGLPIYVLAEEVGVGGYDEIATVWFERRRERPPVLHCMRYSLQSGFSPDHIMDLPLKWRRSEHRPPAPPRQNITYTYISPDELMKLFDRAWEVKRMACINQAANGASDSTNLSA